jgi:hypothetical protein
VLDEGALTEATAEDLVQALEACPEDLHVGLVTFGASVRLYELGGTRVSAECVSGDARPGEAAQAFIARHEHDDAFGVKFVAPLHLSVDSLAGALRGLAGREFGDLTSPRALGAGLETALVLLNAVGAPSGSVLLCSSGPCNRGPGALCFLEGTAGGGGARQLEREAERANTQAMDLFKELRGVAAASRVSVDVFCVGDRSSRWGVRWLCELGRVSLRFNRASVAASLRRDAPASVALRLAGCEVAAAVEAREDFCEDAVTLFLTPVPRADRAVVQLSVAAAAPRMSGGRASAAGGGGEITRTLTWTGSVGGAKTALQLDAVNVDVSGVLVAKQALMQGGPGEARAHVESALGRAARHFAPAGQRLPGALLHLSALLFHFARGPMLGGPAHPEEADCMRAAFMHASLDQAKRLMMVRAPLPRSQP